MPLPGEDLTTAASVDVNALNMDPERKALAAQYGFGQDVPAPALPSHAPTGWTPMPVHSDEKALEHAPRACTPAHDVYMCIASCV